MTTAELIAELKKHDPDAPVLIASYEFGFVPINRVEEISVVPISAKSTFDATHILSECQDGDGTAESVKAICLGDKQPSLVTAERQEA